MWIGVSISLVVATTFWICGCPRTSHSSDGKAEHLESQDADAAVDFYLKATREDPNNSHDRLKLNQARFDAAQQHIQQGLKQRAKGELRMAIAEFQRAQVLDPSSALADQELKQTLDMLAEQIRSAQTRASSFNAVQGPYASHPPELKPLTRAPVNLKMSNDAKIVFDTIGKLAGITVVYDPDLQPRRI